MGFLKQKNKIIGGILVLLFVGVMLCYVISAFKVATGVDAYYYLGVSRLILDGKVPFADFNLGYTPLSFYLMCIPLSVFGDTMTTALVCIYLVQFISSVLICFLINKVTNNRILALLSSLLMLSSSYILEGSYYYLEPFVILWGVLGFIFILREGNVWLFVAGICAGCSFMSKQYGLGYIGLYVIYVLLSESSWKKKICKSGYVIGGFSLLVGTIVLSFLLQGVNIGDMLQLSGTGYAKEGGSSMFVGVQTLCYRFPILVLAILIVLYRKLYKNKLVVCSIVGIFGFLVATFVRSYGHYVQMSIPVTILLVMLVYKTLNKGMLKKLYLVFLFCTVVYQCYNICGVSKSIIRANKKELICTQAKKLQDIIPIGTKDVYISSTLLEVGNVNEYYPPLLKERGMGNGFVADEKGTIDMIHSAKYCIVKLSVLDSRIHDTKEEIYKFLNTNFSKKELTDNNGEYYATVYVRKRM